MVVAKSLEWRQHLQTHWSSFAQGMYVMVQGHLPADDELFIRPENGPHTICLTEPCVHQLAHLVEVQNRVQCDQGFVARLEKEDCLLIGVGKLHRTHQAWGHPFVRVGTQRPQRRGDQCENPSAERIFEARQRKEAAPKRNHARQRSVRRETSGHSVVKEKALIFREKIGALPNREGFGLLLWGVL